MKKLLLTITVVVTTTIVFSQAPQAFNYQAVVRDVNGNILVTEKLKLHSTSVVIGEFTAKILAVEEGALFHGTCNMREEKKKKEQQG